MADLTRNGGADGGVPSNHRRHGRVVCQDLACSLGEILDLSASGMRVKAGRQAPPDGTMMTVVVRTFDGDLTLACKVVWNRRSGVFGRELGITFLNVDRKTQAALTRVGRASAHNEVIRPSIEEARRSA